MKILLTDSRLLQHPALESIFREVAEAGHTVDVDDKLSEYTFIAGGNCWYLIPEVANLFRGALNVRRASEDQTGAVKQPAKANAKRKSAKGAKAARHPRQTRADVGGEG